MSAHSPDIHPHNSDIRLRNIAIHHTGRKILHDVSLCLSSGTLQLLSGANGAGKSTLLRIIAGLEKPEGGSFDLGHGEQGWRQCRADLQARVVYLHQTPYMFDGDVSYNLGYALPRGMSSAERRARIDAALHWAGLGQLAKQDARSLSGGERQRVALARAWLRKPHALLLDEPTANMDTVARERTLELLEHLKKEGHALLVASHDPAHFSLLTDVHYELQDGELSHRDSLQAGTSDKVTPLNQVRA